MVRGDLKCELGIAVSVLFVQLVIVEQIRPMAMDKGASTTSQPAPFNPTD